MHSTLSFRPRLSPSWISTRRLLEQKLEDLHRCKNLNHIKQLHAQIVKHDLQGDFYVIPKLISGMSQYHQLDYAAKVFDQVKFPTIYHYNTLIKVYGVHAKPPLAFATFSKMRLNDVPPDYYTFPFLLKVISGKCLLPVVQMLHAQVEKLGFWADLFVPNSFIDSYFKCGVDGSIHARTLFDTIKERDVVTWNSMVSGLVKCRVLDVARHVFDEMPERDIISWNTLLDGYAKSGQMDMAFNLFETMSERNVVSWSTMIWGYSKVGDMEMAETLFNKMPVKNLIPWTIIISGYAEKGRVKEALNLYEQMEGAGMVPDDGTLVSILTACAESGMLRLGERVYDSIKRPGYCCSLDVNNSFVHMFAKCGRLDKARNHFDLMPRRDLISWNCLLHGLAINGRGKEALDLFSSLKEEGFNPDKVTFVALLCACTHSGHVDEGIHYFNTMEREYKIAPGLEHYGCMVDLLGRAGRIKEALKLIQEMPMKANNVIWGTLLGACRMHGASRIADFIAESWCKVECMDAGNFSILSNIFAAEGDWSKKANMRLRLRNTGMEKICGCSSIEVANEVHDFSVFDKSHAEFKNIYHIIHQMQNEMKKPDYPINV